MKIDLEKLDNLVNLMERRELGELEFVEGDSTVALELAPPRRGVPGAGRAELVDPVMTVTAPRVGIFLQRVAVGDRVAAGALLAELRVMDVKYRLSSPAAGRIEEVLVEDGMGVEYGQPLLRLNPEGAAE